MCPSRLLRSRVPAGLESTTSASSASDRRINAQRLSHSQSLGNPADSNRPATALVVTARRAIENNSPDFEAHLDELRGKNFMILWRQDWFVIDRLKWLSESPHHFPNAREHAALVATG